VSSAFLQFRSFNTRGHQGGELETCKDDCTASGFCCHRDSGCMRPSCAIGCEIASISANVTECRSFCQQATGTCYAFPPTVVGCVRQANTCQTCTATCGSGTHCEPEGGCEHACERYFGELGFAALQKEDGELERCPQYGNESKMEFLSDGIFTFWWQTGFETLHVAREAAAVFAEVRADAQAKGMPDPPNPGKGYYFNVYLHRGAQDEFPHSWGAGVGTNKHGLPYMTIGAALDYDLWRHEAFHVFQYSTRGIPYSGDTMWAIEATASFYALIKDSSEKAAFVNNILLSNNPHLALWHSFTNGPTDEVGIWDYGVRQYGIQSMLWWITKPKGGKPPSLSADLIYAALTEETPIPGGLQAYLFDHDPEGFRHGFLDWAAHTTNDHDYLTAEQLSYAEVNMRHSAGPSAQHPFAARSGRRTEALYTLRPEAALKPRGWAYNVILLSDTAPGNFTFRLIGDASGSEGAGAHFVACALVAGEASVDIVNFRMDSALEGSVDVNHQPSGGTVKLVIAATPAHFTGNQNYGYNINVHFVATPVPPRPAPTPSPSAACACGCHGAGYAPDDRNDPPNDCWLPGIGYDQPCCAAPAPQPATPAPSPTPAPTPSPSAACACGCHGAGYAPDDRNDPPSDCWIPGVGYDKPCCP